MPQITNSDRIDIGEGYAVGPDRCATIKNTSGLKPLGRSVLIEPYTPERKQGLIELPAEVQVRTDMIEQRAKVIEVGARAWMDEGEPRARPGDKVLVAAYAGHMAVGTADGKQYRFINDRDIFAQIEVES